MLLDPEGSLSALLLLLNQWGWNEDGSVNSDPAALCADWQTDTDTQVKTQDSDPNRHVNYSHIKAAHREFVVMCCERGCSSSSAPGEEENGMKWWRTVTEICQDINDPVPAASTWSSCLVEGGGGSVGVWWSCCWAQHSFYVLNWRRSSGAVRLQTETRGLSGRCV